MASFAREFGGFYPILAGDIFAFCQALSFQPTWQQEQLFGVIQRGDRRVAVRSGQGPGKTTAACIVALWRIFRQYNALGIVTAPTMRQCQDIFLAEARRLLEKADPWLKKFIKITRTRVRVADMPDWGINAVTATTSEQAQGFHDPNLFVIAEEASGIERPIIEQFTGTLSNPNSLFLMIGNPNSRDCAFFDCFHKNHTNWTCLHWNAEETPKSEWFDPARNHEVEALYGRNSDVYRIRVLGEFPHQDPNCVMSDEDVTACMDRSLIMRCAQINPTIKQFGLDFARFGGDENTIYRRSGNAIVEWAAESRIEPVLMIDRAARMQMGSGWLDRDCTYIADAGGIGQGCMHRFYDLKKQVYEFHFNGRAGESGEFENQVTEAYFQLARKVRDRTCALPNDSILSTQLSSRRYYLTKNGKIVLESKDDYMKRGYDSPDRADGLVLAMYDSAIGRGQVAGVGSGSILVGRRVHDNAQVATYGAKEE
jgi:hypothetical protein